MESCKYVCAEKETLREIKRGLEKASDKMDAIKTDIAGIKEMYSVAVVKNAKDIEASSNYIHDGFQRVYWFLGVLASAIGGIAGWVQFKS